MSTEAIKATVRENFEAYDRGDLDGQIALYAPEAKIHFPGSPGPLERQAFRQTLEMFRAAFSSGQHTLDDQVADGDTVVTRWTWRAKHTGDFQGIPPTGRQVTMTGMAIDRVVGGKIVERWGQFDAMGLVQQLTATPATTGTR